MSAHSWGSGSSSMVARAKLIVKSNNATMEDLWTGCIRMRIGTLGLGVVAWQWLLCKEAWIWATRSAAPRCSTAEYSMSSSLPLADAAFGVFIMFRHAIVVFHKLQVTTSRCATSAARGGDKQEVTKRPHIQYGIEVLNILSDTSVRVRDCATGINQKNTKSRYIGEAFHNTQGAPIPYPTRGR
eukprot:1377532-Pleurochrysis_carterae.AAC.12